MHTIDWIIVFTYLLAMLVIAARIGRHQTDGQDYFLGGRRMRPFSLAMSTVATQCSTNSLLGAPAFVGFAIGGGLIWLQYELAVPIAMLLLIWLLGSVRAQRHVSVYGFLEDRLGRSTRKLASGMFLFFRGVATGVTVYGVSIMVSLVVDVSYTQAVLILMGVTVLYDVLGGMRAVVYSDVAQLTLIIVAVGACLFMVVGDIGGWSALWEFQNVSERGAALDFSWGFDGTSDFGFWPMLFGGLFLYMAYYGCDQSQAQRVLASADVRDAERVLLWSGLLRFPIVLLYCLLGLALAAYSGMSSGFVESLPAMASGAPNYNLVVPSYVLSHFPAGLVGLVLVGIAAAAMSSIDSSLNALSAATIEDFLKPLRGWKDAYTFVGAKLLTLAWGLFAIGFSYQVEAIAPTILEAINKIGSVANGPLLALFVIALWLPSLGQRRAILGFCAGLATNIAMWLFVPDVSWLWWNVIGCVVALLVSLLSGLRRPWTPSTHRPHVQSIYLLVSMTLIISMTGLFFGIA